MNGASSEDSGMGTWLLCGIWSSFLCVSGNERQRKNHQPAQLSPRPRRSPAGALGTSAPGSSRLASWTLVGAGLWASGSVSAACPCQFRLGANKPLACGWVQFWPLGPLGCTHLGLVRRAVCSTPTRPTSASGRPCARSAQFPG